MNRRTFISRTWWGSVGAVVLNALPAPVQNLVPERVIKAFSLEEANQVLKEFYLPLLQKQLNKKTVLFDLLQKDHK